MLGHSSKLCCHFEHFIDCKRCFQLSVYLSTIYENLFTLNKKEPYIILDKFGKMFIVLNN